MQLQRPSKYIVDAESRGPSHISLAGYSYLSAAIGSTFVARRAGMKPATHATPESKTTATNSATGSRAPSPKRNVAGTRVAPRDIKTPARRPPARITATSLITSANIALRPAPSAMRIPNFRLPAGNQIAQRTIKPDHRQQQSRTHILPPPAILNHSSRSATIGSIRDARHAGIRQAAPVTRPSNIVAAKKTVSSRGCTP